METLQTTSSSFGELLKTYRKRKRLTQQQVAQQLDVNKNTISSWELGTYLPATRGLVLELARHLEMNEPETRQFLEASLTALSPYWYVPFPRNLFFAGREEFLNILQALCTLIREIRSSGRMPCMDWAALARRSSRWNTPIDTLWNTAPSSGSEQKVSNISLPVCCISLRCSSC